MAVLLLASTPSNLLASRQTIFHYEPETSTLFGVIQTMEHFGPPNYGENPETDQREVAYILLLDQSIRVEPTPGHIDASGIDTDTFNNVSRVQLAAPAELTVSSFIGKHVAVTGKLYERFSGHHITDVLIMADKVDLLQR
ncbi:MAG TPA: DUF4431 domain-containing protein [Parvularculaceae bacterium]|nr:DUF4431 domain-containing protein [Parvularculaceae bacterium]